MVFVRKISYLLSVAFVLLISCKKEKETSLIESIGEISDLASIGDTLEIKGENFPLKEGSLMVYFGEVKAQIIAQKVDLVKFIVPVLKSSNTQIFLKNEDNHVLKKQSFKLAPVSITSIINKVKTGGVVEVFGKNLQLLNNLKLTVDGKVIESIQVSSRGLTFKMPESINPGRVSTVSLADSAVSAKLETVVADKWARVAYSPFVFRELFESFVYNEEGYILSHDKEGIDKKVLLYKLNPDTYKYTTYVLPNTVTNAFATPKYIYYVDNGNDIYRYNIVNGTATYMTKRPSPNEYKNKYFSIGENIYVCALPTHILNAVIDYKFYKYDVANGTWSAIANFPEGTVGYSEKIAVDGNKAYVIKDYQKMYVYDADNNTWAIKSFSINPNVNYVTAFYSQRGKVYALITPGMSHEKVCEYTPDTNSWEDLGVLRNEITNNFYGFFIGNKHFIGGNKHDSFSSDLYESDTYYLFNE